MKSMCCALGLLAMVAVAPVAHAATASWTGNRETDVEAYEIYACDVVGCVVSPVPAMLKGTVVHVGPGAPHAFEIDLSGKEGRLAILARDTAQNKSGLSVSIPFDKAPPSVPATPTLQ